MESASGTTIVVAHWDWVLWRYNREFLTALQQGGRRVLIVCPRGRYTAELEELGLEHRDWTVTRRGLSPVAEAGAVRELVRYYRQEQPQVVWHLTVKPSLYGSIAARRAGVPHVVNTYTGLGFLFGRDGMAPIVRRLLRPVAGQVLRAPNVHSIVLNPEDHDRLVAERWIAPERTRIIPSSGVDTTTYHPAADEPDRRPFRVLLAARLLVDKGVDTYVAAAHRLRDQGHDVRFLLAGEPDPGNPRSVTAADVRAWQRSGVVEILGHVEAMPELFRSVHAAALPTRYNEGVPSFLLEAAATGLPLIATGGPGCRLVVVDGSTGIQVPAADDAALAEAVARLASSPDLARAMGRRARELVVEKFDVDEVVAAYRELHDSVVSGADVR